MDTVSVLGVVNEITNPMKIMEVQKELFDFHSNIAGFLKHRKVPGNEVMDYTETTPFTNQNNPHWMGYITIMKPLKNGTPGSGTFENLDYVPQNWYNLHLSPGHLELTHNNEEEPPDIPSTQGTEYSFDRVVTP